MQVPRQEWNDNFWLECLQLWDRIVGDSIQQCTSQRDGGSDNETVGRVSLAFLTAGGLRIVCKDGEGADEVFVTGAQGWILVEVAYEDVDVEGAAESIFFDTEICKVSILGLVLNGIYIYGDGLTHGSGCYGSRMEDDCLRVPGGDGDGDGGGAPYASHGSAPRVSHGNAPHANHGGAVPHRLVRLFAGFQLSPGQD